MRSSEEPWTQWAAVNTQFSSTRDPPQNWLPPREANIACHGQLPFSAVWPPTIRDMGGLMPHLRANYWMKKRCPYTLMSLTAKTQRDAYQRNIIHTQHLHPNYVLKYWTKLLNFLYLKAVVLVWCSEKSNTKSNNAVAACSVISLLLWQIIINIQDVYLNLIFTFFLVLYEATQFNRRFYGRGTEITDTPQGQFM